MTLQFQTPNFSKRATYITIKLCFPNQDLKGKSVAVIGLGKSGIAAARLALARGASVLAVDQNEHLDPFKEIQFDRDSCLKMVLGNFDNELLQNVDRVVVSPGVSLGNYGITSLVHLGKHVLSELDFAAEVLPKSTKILAVTGTNGKSTVATFAGQMLSQLGIKAFVGGNLGIPLSEASLRCLTSSSEKPAFQVAVVEVSSYQLEIPNMHFSPSVAVVLNLTPDHLERHKTMKNYAATKCRVFSHMRDKKMAILPYANSLKSQTMSSCQQKNAVICRRITSGNGNFFLTNLLCYYTYMHYLQSVNILRTYLINSGNQYLNEAIEDHVDDINLASLGSFPGLKVDYKEKLAEFEIPTIGCISNLDLGEMKTIGAHNYQNAAVAALSLIGLDIEISSESISSTIGKLKAPPHRMQIVHKDNRGVTWVDDSKATNVDATYTGLLGLKERKPVIVLLGGLAKVLDDEGSIGFEQLVEPLRFHKSVITFGASGTAIENTLLAYGLNIPCIRVRNLKEAVELARSIARDGDIVLLSPGCASFDEFKDFEHRGKVFRELAFSS